MGRQGNRIGGRGEGEPDCAGGNDGEEDVVGCVALSLVVLLLIDVDDWGFGVSNACDEEVRGRVLMLQTWTSRFGYIDLDCSRHFVSNLGRE